MKKLAGFLGMLAMVAVAPLARADFEISVDGVNCVYVVNATPNGSVVCGSVTAAAGVTIQVLSLIGSQTPGFSETLGSTLIISNLSGATATITIGLADQNFSSPTTPPFINDASGLTINPTVGTGSAALISCVDQSNGLVPPGGPFCATPAPGMAGPNASLSFAGATTASDNSYGTITSLGAPFSLTQTLTIVADAGSQFNVTSSQVLMPVPEPSAIVLLGTAALCVGGLVRRRLAKRA
jgi:hypothetical protein